MYRELIYEISKEDGYAKITLNRPKKRNAISIDLANELHDAILKAKAEKQLKFLVLTGTGEQAFCSGGDLNDFHGDMEEQEVLDLLQKVKQVLIDLTNYPLPTICMLNGHSRGGGCELASACDFRFAKEDTTHGYIQGRLGIIPGFGGGALLYKRIPDHYASYWLTTSEVITEIELRRWGWIHKSYNTEGGIVEVLKPFLAKHRNQMLHFKHQLLSQPAFQNIEEEMDKEVRTCARLWVSEEHKNAVRSFFK